MESQAPQHLIPSSAYSPQQNAREMGWTLESIIKQLDECRKLSGRRHLKTSEDFKTHIINDSTSEFEHQNNLQCTKCVRDFKMLKLGNNYTGEKRGCRQHVEESCFVLSG